MSEVSRRISTRSKSATAINNKANEARRKEHQKHLLKNLLDTCIASYANSNDSKSISNDSNAKDIIYPILSETSISKFNGPLYIDQDKFYVIFDFNGFVFPLHVSFIKSISKLEDSGIAFLKINTSISDLKRSDVFVLKSFSIKCTDVQKVSAYIKNINELKKDWSLSLVKQTQFKNNGTTKIDLGRDSGLSLNEIYTRPAFTGKKVPGYLKLFNNGIRYESVLYKDNVIEIDYRNIKQIFLQSCESENCAILHLSLNNQIIIGKKAGYEIQFYREVFDSLVDETSGRKRKFNYEDEDEIAEELEEKKKRKMIDFEFLQFSKKLGELSRIVLEQPLKELSFPGIFSRQNINFQPTSNSLIYITEPPFLVINWKDVEIIYFERIIFGLKNFDLVFIFKDHSKTPMHISSIPVNFLETLKDLIDTYDIPYAESSVNFNWTTVMKTINDDPLGFYQMGGWSFLQPDAGEASSTETEESEYNENQDEESSYSESEYTSEIEESDSVEQEDDNFSNDDDENSQ